MEAFVYGLIDPTTRLVRYVGQTRNMSQRYEQHCRGRQKCTGAWVRSLSTKPVLVVLEVLTGPDVLRDSYASETKWIKRFRRTVINERTRDTGPGTWDRLINH
jgi:predicted GIY-YIG superfamily endonuclease